MHIGLNKINHLYQLKNYFNIRIYIIPISTLIYFVRYVALLVIFFTFQYGSTLMSDKTYHPRQFLIYIPIWFYFNDALVGKVDNDVKFTFQYGSTLIHSCQFRIFFMLICSFLSTSLYLFYFPIHFIMFFIKKLLIPFIYIPLSTSSLFYFIEHRQNFSLLIYIICKFNSIISHFIISTLHNFNFFAWTQIN